VIVTESYAVCEQCGFRVPAEEHPQDWLSIVQDDRRATYCSRDCLKGAIAGDTPLPTQSHMGLTSRDASIVRMVARGVPNAQIAVHLGLSEKTVKNRMTVIRRLFGADDRAHLVTMAHARGLIDCAQLAAETG